MDDGIIRLVTARERDELQDAKDREDDHAEAIAMLERMLAIARADDRRLAGVAIAFVFENGGYGELVPSRCGSMAAMVGAVATMQQRLVTRTLLP